MTAEGGAFLLVVDRGCTFCLLLVRAVLGRKAVKETRFLDLGSDQARALLSEGADPGWQQTWHVLGMNGQRQSRAKAFDLLPPSTLALRVAKIVARRAPTTSMRAYTAVAENRRHFSRAIPPPVKAWIVRESSSWSWVE